MPKYKAKVNCIINGSELPEGTEIELSESLAASYLHFGELEPAEPTEPAKPQKSDSKKKEETK
jgi:hypothetical protein